MAILIPFNYMLIHLLVRFQMGQYWQFANHTCQNGSQAIMLSQPLGVMVSLTALHITNHGEQLKSSFRKPISKQIGGTGIGQQQT
jgi:hypothetical protein